MFWSSTETSKVLWHKLEILQVCDLVIYIKYCRINLTMTILISIFYIPDNRILDSTFTVFKTVLFFLLIGTGRGGKSIWGKKFADELSPALRVSVVPCYIHPTIFNMYVLMQRFL